MAVALELFLLRSQVYVSTGTIASGGNLGLDSNNKIVKATEASGDLTSIVAGTGLSGTDGKACWKGYTLRGTKKKGGRTVDNCVKTKRKRK